MGKHKRNLFKSKKCISTSKSLQLLHIDLFGPTRTMSVGGKSYGFVIIDDYTRYTWVFLLALKHEALKICTFFCKQVQNKKGYTITSIMSDHRKKFENLGLEQLCDGKWC